MAKVRKKDVRSGFEWEIISSAQARGMALSYEPWKIEYIPKPRWYTPDVELPNGIVIEIKGRLTVFDRVKHLLIQAQHPDVDIRFVFQYDNKLFKKAKSRYSDWCDKHGFKYAFGAIPQEWYDE